MKEKLLKVVCSKPLGVVIGALIVIILMAEEKALGDMTNSWALGLITSLFTGCLVEAFRYVIAKKVIWANLILWALGSGIGIAIMYLV